MGFIDSYKRLEKLCGEVLNDDRRISAYIDEMVNNPRGSYYVRTWDDDLKKLKHYRWVRNKITHEPGYNEDNMCEPSDTWWLDDFYLRIMNQNDPLTLYYKATRNTYNTYSSYHQTKSINTQYQNYKAAPQNSAGCATIMVVSLLFVIVVAALTVV